jgi:hypothetical protein
MIGLHDSHRALDEIIEARPAIGGDQPLHRGVDESSALHAPAGVEERDARKQPE